MNTPNIINDEADTAEVMQATFCRFSRAELDYMRTETGANADATAIACFCRKNMPPEVRAATARRQS